MISKNVMVQATDLCRYFGSGETLVKAIDKISFSIDKGSFTICLLYTSPSPRDTR